MFNLGLYFKTLGLTKTKVFLNLGLKSVVIRAYENQIFLKSTSPILGMTLLVSNSWTFIRSLKSRSWSQLLLPRVIFWLLTYLIFFSINTSFYTIIYYTYNLKVYYFTFINNFLRKSWQFKKSLNSFLTKRV